MPDPAITPASVGATTYEITNSRGLIADLRLDVPISAPFPTFDLTFPTAAQGLQIKLVKGAVELSLLPGPLTNDATFSNRLISTSSFDEGANTVLTVEIKAAALAALGENWRVQLRAADAARYQLTQVENDPGSPTIARLMCDPVARFAIGGEATAGAGGAASITEKGSVTLQVEAAISPATVVKVAHLPLPQVSYRWTQAGSFSIPELPACGQDPHRVSFFAPHVGVASEIQLRLETWLEGGCPANVGWLNASATAALRVNPLGAEFVVGPEMIITSGNQLDLYPCYLLNENNGIYAIWASWGTPDGPGGGGGRIFTSSLNLHDVSSGFINIRQITTEYTSVPDAALVPGGGLIVTYRKNHTVPTDANRNVMFRRAAFDDLSTVPEQRITDGAGVHDDDPFVYVSGDLAVFFYNDTGNLKFRRHHLPSGTWLDGTSQNPASTDMDGQFHAAQDLSGNIWISITAVKNLSTNAKEWRAIKLTPSTGAKTLEVVENYTDSGYSTSFVLCLNDNDIWVFRSTQVGISYSRCLSGAWQAKQPLPNATSADSSAAPYAIADSAGGIWLFWSRYDSASQSYTTSFMRRHPATGSWGAVQKLLGVGLDFALMTPNNTIWLFDSYGQRDPPTINLSCRRIVTII